MKIILTNHAKSRMSQRNISLKEIEETIGLPDYILTKSDKIEANKKIGNKSIKVIYSKKGNFIKIITVVDKWK